MESGARWRDLSGGACSLLVLALVVASCGPAAPRARRPGTLEARERAPSTDVGDCGPAEEPRICAVAIIDVDAGTASVTLRLDPAALPADREEVVLAFGEASVEPEEAWAPLGALPEPLELRYRVTLDASPPAPGRSFRRAGGWHLRGQSFLPELEVDGEPVDVAATLRIDAGAQPIWTSAGERRIFDAPSLRRLAEEAYEVGALSTARREVAGATLWVAASEGEPGALDPVADVLAGALRSLSARLGPPPTDGILVAFHASEHEPPFAARLGSTLVQVSPSGTPRDGLFGLADLALRELAHLFVPGTHAVGEDWLEEGLADYFTALGVAELTAAPPASAARIVLRGHQRYAAAPERRALRDESAGGEWARDAGLVVGFCLDAHLRESGSSLGAALATTFARDERAIGAEALLEVLAAISPSSASYLAALLESEGAFAIDDCLERSGLEAREVSYEGWTDAALTDALGLGDAARPLALLEALAVPAPREGSALEPGDVITEVEGARVGDLADLAWALRDVGAGERARLAVRRRGQVEAIEVLIPAAEARREERAHLELVPIDRALAATR